MKVLVLGGRGFIGRYAVAALQAAGHQVRIGSRRPLERGRCLVAGPQADGQDGFEPQ